jgi:hypothetical protein
MQCNKASSYSITSSALASSAGGMVRPSALAPEGWLILVLKEAAN